MIKLKNSGGAPVYLLLIGVLLAPCFMGCWHDFETTYANPSVKKRFSQIHRGDPVSHVFAEVGEPLFAEINHERLGMGGYWREHRDRIAVSDIVQLTSNSNIAVYLHYSWPSRRARGYDRYQIDIIEGRVAEIDAGVLVD